MCYNSHLNWRIKCSIGSSQVSSFYYIWVYGGSSAYKSRDRRAIDIGKAWPKHDFACIAPTYQGAVRQDPSPSRLTLVSNYSSLRSCLLLAVTRVVAKPNAELRSRGLGLLT